MQTRKSSSSSSPELAKALAAARREGLATEWTDLKAKPTAPARNAAPVYLEAERLYHKLPENDRIADAEQLSEALGAGPLSKGLTILKHQTALLKLGEKAAALPEYAMERDWSKGMLLTYPEFATARQLARLFCLRALLASEAGKPEEALADVARAGRIGAQIGSEPTLLSLLVGIACSALADRAFVKVLQRHGEKPSVLTAARKANAAFGPPPDLRHSLRGELPIARIALVSQLKLAQKHSPNAREEPLVDPLRRDPKLVVAWDISLVNYWRAVYQELAKNELLTLTARLEALEKSLQKRQSKDDILTLFLAPTITPIVGRVQQINALAALRDGALTVLETRLRTGALPTSLALPTDPFDGKPLRYKPTATGFVLYSVGENGTDDGGSDEKVMLGSGDDKSSRPRDLVFRYGK